MNPISPASLSTQIPSADRLSLSARYRDVRRFTEELCEPLAAEDYVIQSMTDASPTKWHLAHTTWFFENFILREAVESYRPFHPQYFYLFNSYYIGAGERFERARRGMLSRPTVGEVYEYRHAVDERVLRWLEQADETSLRAWEPVLVLGLNHEQQHQELLVTDLKHMLSQNPLDPVYRYRTVPGEAESPMRWIGVEEGLYEIGSEGDGFFYDNEGPRHRQFIPAVRLGSRPVTNREYLEFLQDDGYQNHVHWLSEGWERVRAEGWLAPLYWRKRDEEWWQFTLQGLRPVPPAEPVTHISFFEADAYARWAGARLPTEFEWEAAAKATPVPVEGRFAESRLFHPAPCAPAPDRSLDQMFGDVWQWTQSAYAPYPGYRPSPTALGEYNGKWMCNQYVLRGGSCATPISHIRPTYRNFFPAYARWQFSGIRLAKDA